jgi:predicted nucleic acid-binding Zn ribbon protein
MEMAQHICPVCGHPIDIAAAVFCPRCGSELAASGPTVPAVPAAEPPALKDEDRRAHPILWFFTPALLALIAWLSPHGREYLLAALVFFAFGLLTNAAYFALGTRLRLHVRQFSVFSGRWVIKIGRFRIGWFPFGGSVSFGTKEDGLAWDGSEGTRPFEDLHPMSRVVACLIGPCICLAVGIALLGTGTATDFIGESYRQLFRGAWFSSSFVADSIRWLLAFFAPSGNVLVGAGFAGTFLATMSFLPLPFSALGLVFGTILEWVTGKGRVWKTWNILSTLTALASFGFYVFWLFVLYRVLRYG